MSKTVTEINNLNSAVNEFTEQMKDKLATTAAKGRRGWDTVDIGALREGLQEQFEKLKHIPDGHNASLRESMIDIANFAMFIAKATERDITTVDFEEK